MPFLYPIYDYNGTSPWATFGSGGADIQHSRLASGPDSPDDTTGLVLADSILYDTDPESEFYSELKWGMSNPSVGIDTGEEVRIGVRISSAAGLAQGASTFTLKLYQGETLIQSYGDTVPTESSVVYYNYSQAITDPTDITDPNDLYLVFDRGPSVSGSPEPLDRTMRITEVWISYTEGSGGAVRRSLLPLMGCG